MGFYTIKQLADIVDRTPATLYAYMRESDENTNFFKEHRKEQTKGGYLYDTIALERLKNRFGVSDGVEEEIFSPTDGESPQSAPPPTDAEVETLKKEIEELKAKIEQLESEKERLLNQNEELIKQNANSQQLISQAQQLAYQEKQEKMLLLEAPRKSIFDRMKEAFKKRD